jgi:hypothetical protein
MFKHGILLLLILGVSLSVSAQNLGCEKIVQYQMNATLHPENKTVTGTEVLTWRNTSDLPVSDLYFHAYLNAFKNTGSTFLTEAVQGLARYDRVIYDRPKDGWGYLDIQSITADCNGLFSSADLMPSFSYVHPDDENAKDETVFKVALPRPVNPGMDVVLNISFESKLPYDAPRTGFFGDYFFVAQWFPKIGVLVDGKWNCHQFHTNSEFFSDYGSYDISLTVPKKYVVGATGMMTDSTLNADGTVTLRFQQDCVHDFVWTAYPHYKVATRMFEYPELPPVKMRLLYQPEHSGYVSDFFDATANTLKHYGIWYVPYPYAQLTIVDAAWRSRTGGMEYPTFFTTEVNWLEADGAQNPHSLTVHECGHQFWYGLIGNNEFEDAWMDEGFDSYSDSRCLDASYGLPLYYKTYLGREGFEIPIAFPGAKIDLRTCTLENYRKNANKDPIEKLSYTMMDGGSYGSNAYDKPALVLWSLEGYLGEETFSKIMKVYAGRYAFKHPKPKDFIEVVNEIAGERMDWFFEQTLGSAKVLDYAVEEVSAKQVIEPVGLSGSGKEKQYRALSEDKKNKPYESTVIVRRLGEVQIPVEIRIQFEDGETFKDKWDGRDLWKRYSFTRLVQVRRADVDPERKLVLDIDYTNNSRYRKTDNGAAMRWASKWMYWLQHFLETVAFYS